MLDAQRAGNSLRKPSRQSASIQLKTIFEWMLRFHLWSRSLRRMIDGFAYNNSKKHETLVYGVESDDRAQPRASIAGAPALS